MKDETWAGTVQDLQDEVDRLKVAVDILAVAYAGEMRMRPELGLRNVVSWSIKGNEIANDAVNRARKEA